MLNLLSDQGNADQNNFEYHLTPVRIAKIKKKTMIAYAGEDVE